MFMKDVNMTPAFALAQSIKELSPAPMDDADVQEAARNLAGFFSLLIEIDKNQQNQSGEGLTR